MIAEALGGALLHSLWQIALLVLALAAAAPLLARISAHARYLIYCATLLAMPLIALVTFVALYRSGPEIGSAAWATSDALWSPAATSTLLARVAPWLVGVWLVGVGLSTVRLVAGCMQVRRLRSRAEPLAPDLARVVDDILCPMLVELGIDLRAGLHESARVTVAESLAVTVPTLVGWLRPVILMPVGLVTQLSHAELRAVIAHELGHVRRYDPLVNVLQSVIEALFFYHPGVRWLSRQIREEREYCCDDLAVRVAGDPVAYALALTELEARRGTLAARTHDVSPSAVAATAINPKGGPLMTRIRRIVQPTQHSIRVSSWFMPGFLAMVIAAGALVSACEADTEDTGERAHALHSGTAIFIGEDGETQKVSGDHVWFSYHGEHADGDHSSHDGHKGKKQRGVVIKLAHGADAKGHVHEGHEMPAPILATIKKLHLESKASGESHASFVHEDGTVVDLTGEQMRELHVKLQQQLHGDGEPAAGEPHGVIVVESVEHPDFD